MWRRVDLQQIPFVAALIQADAPLGVSDELELRRLQLEIVHVEAPVDAAGIEQELVGGDGEQGPGQFPDALHIKVLQILRGQDHGGLFLSHPLEGVADIFDGSEIAQPDVQLIQRGYCVALGEQPVAEVGEYIEEHGIFHTAVGLEQTFDTEDQEAGTGDVGVSIEKFALRAAAHGVEAQQDLPQQITGVQRIFLTVIGLVDFLDLVIEVGEGREVLRLDGLDLGVVIDAPLGIQALQHQLDGVDVPVCKVLVAAEKILQEGDMLAEPGVLPEGVRCLRVLLVIIAPQFGL